MRTRVVDGRQVAALELDVDDGSDDLDDLAELLCRSFAALPVAVSHDLSLCSLRCPKRLR